MNKHHYKGYDIEVFDDSEHRFGANHNKFHYSKYYFGESNKNFPASRHGIKVYKNKKEINDGIVIGFANHTNIHKHSSLLDSNLLLLGCCDTVFCLTIPDLELKWKLSADQSACLQIFNLDKNFLIHGESQITVVDKNGNVKWKFLGENVFVTENGEQEIKIKKDCIIITDCYNTKYKLDYNGKLISHQVS